jgi:hypothetical protein
MFTPKFFFKPRLVTVWNFCWGQLYGLAFRLGCALLNFSKGKYSRDTRKYRKNQFPAGEESKSKTKKRDGILQQEVKEDSSKIVGNLAIVVTTFSARFFDYCIPLLRQLRSILPSVPIYLVVNGDFENTFETKHRDNFLQQVLSIGGINPITFGTFRGCASMWNTGVRAADVEYCLVLNDDMQIDSRYFLAMLNDVISMAAISGVVLINQSWSHFVISRELILGLGYFDERFLGIGEEDVDFTWRYENKYGKITSYKTKSILHESVADHDVRLAKGQGKYSLFNWVFSEIKYKSGSGIATSMNLNLTKQVIPDQIEYPGDVYRRNLIHLLGNTNIEIIRTSILAQITEN